MNKLPTQQFYMGGVPVKATPNLVVFDANCYVHLVQENK
jgi:hypothetical protein